MQTTRKYTECNLSGHYSDINSANIYAIFLLIFMLFFCYFSSIHSANIAVIHSSKHSALNSAILSALNSAILSAIFLLYFLYNIMRFTTLYGHIAY